MFFSALAELRTYTPHLYHFRPRSPESPNLLSFGKVVLNTASASDKVGFPRKTSKKGEIFNVARIHIYLLRNRAFDFWKGWDYYNFT